MLYSCYLPFIFRALSWLMHSFACNNQSTRTGSLFKSASTCDNYILLREVKLRLKTVQRSLSIAETGTLSIAETGTLNLGAVLKLFKPLHHMIHVPTMEALPADEIAFVDCDLPATYFTCQPS